MQTLSGLKNAFRIYKGCSSLSLYRMSYITPHTLAANDKRTCYTKVHGVQSIAPLVRSVEETPEPIPTIVKGTIPKWIHGSLLRNGPGKFEFGNQHYNHWFDGMALLHRFQIEGGQVTYRSRFLRSDSYKQNSERNRIMVSEFGTLALPDPCKNIFQRFLSRFEMPKSTDNASVNFMKYKGDYYVSTETNFMHRVDPETLETKQKVDWSKFLAVNGATAHPHVDPDGTAYNMGNSYGKKGTFYNIIMVPPKTEGPEDTLNGAKILCSIAPHDKSKPSYYHSFGMSENYVVFIEQPIKMDLIKILTSKLKGKALSDCIYWDPNQETIFHLIDKQTGKESQVKYHAKAMSTFHQINAFEQDGFLMLDMCCSDDGNAINNFLIQNMHKSGEALDKMYDSIGRPYPRRFVLPLNITKETPLEQNLNTRCDSKATAVCRTENQITKEDILKKVGNHSVLAPIHFYRMDTEPMQVKGGQLTTSFKIASFVFSGRKKVIQVFCTFEDLHGDDLNDYGGLEFPHINYAKYNTKPYRYFYGCGFRNLVGDSLIKMDLGNKKFKVWCQPDLYPSEPVFIPSPNAVEEDDGIILSVVITPTKNQSSFLLVLDAKTFEELGRAEVPVNIPYGFHGTFSSSV